MSGGSLDYAFHTVEDAASAVAFRASTNLHRAFAAHLRNVATALHDLECMWSGDSGPGKEEASIRAVVRAEDELRQAIAEAIVIRDELARLIGMTTHSCPEASATTE